MPAKQPVITVASRPTKPLLIYDGDCNFCKFWILRWQRFTRERVDYVASQEARVGEQFPELPRVSFEESVQLVETDGKVYAGAEAVFRTLTYGPCRKWPLWIYEQMPGFAPVAECLYHFVAKRRTGFSALTRLLWGGDGALPSRRLTGWVFLRLLGIIYLCAFASLGTQIVGLSGQNGIQPVALMMGSMRAQADAAGIGWERYHLVPTLCWFKASDRFLRMLCVSGCVLAGFVIADVAPAVCLFLLWVIYLSLASVCQPFLGFQWDALLLETGFLAIFFAPWRIWPIWLEKRRHRAKLAHPLTPALSPSGGEGEENSRVALWLLWWLLFRLMFESGVVKLASGDPTWRHLMALDYHYQTQPLPTWIGWYAHQLPEGFQKFCVLMMFGIELGVPFLIFTPRRLRFVGCWLLIFLQVIILLTGNYCFFNWLTIALCLLLLDDAALRKLVPKWWRRKLPGANAASGSEREPEHSRVLADIEIPANPVIIHKISRRWPWWLAAPLACVILLVSVQQVWDTLHGARGRLASPEWLSKQILPFDSLNSYGLFAMMTTERPEIIIEGSDDGKTWLPYEFRYKPGDLKRPPAFVAPHQPRLDWQMWFAALSDYQQNRWFVNFCLRLLQGAPEVLALMEKNPFPDAPPRYIRAQLYEYIFTDLKERRADGAWWRREYKGEYLPAISLPASR